MAFEYKMVQIPPTLVVEKEQQSGQIAADYLQRLTNEMATQGWEFYRVDSFVVEVRPGCWGALTGQRSGTTTYYVVTFRKPRG